MYADVIIQYSSKKIDKIFTYIIPFNLKDKLQRGMKVVVPFNNGTINGFVLDIKNEYSSEYELKEIISIVDEELVLSQELISLASFLSEETLCSRITAIETMLPSSLKVKAKKSNHQKLEKIVKLNPSININEYLNKKGNEKQREIIKLFENKDEYSYKKLECSSLNTLIKHNILLCEERQVYRINISNEVKVKELTPYQNDALNQIKSYSNKYNTILLHGITGSGKTEIYIKLIKDVISCGKRALVLVPEISLTTQIAKRFYEAFSSDVAILHSSLSIGEKYDEYLKIIRDEVSVVVGTRSAVFAPIHNLGIIIIDEEDSTSYKQDVTPKYHARDMAIFRAKYNDIPLILGSATPSLETKARADKGIYKLVTLNKRVGNSRLPDIHVVDMEGELKQGNNLFSDLLKMKIQDRLNKKEQIIILLNRRGFSTFITCSNCGYTYKCPNCDISLTYHKTTNNLICHYCGYKIKKSDKCPNCGEDALNYFGMGTEKIEQELIKLYPEAKVIRMDQDVTRNKGMHEKIITEFREEKYDILVGTQMVSKGLDFPKVSLVGVINADTTLNIPDYRSGENTFSLLSQVAGRAGRSDINGEVVIQTFNPDNYIIEQVKNQDYQKYYIHEMNFRHALKYPPYYYLVLVKIIGKDYNETFKEANKIKKYLDDNLLTSTIVLGPTMATILKFNNDYRLQILIKYQFDNKLKDVLHELDNLYIYNKNVRIDIDFSPLRI